MDKYTISIDMDQDTVEQLVENGFSLYAFKAVGTSASSGRPTVWVKTQTFSLSTKVTWQEQFAAYTSLTTKLDDGTQIDAAASYDINLGSTLNVNSPSGVGSVATTGTAGAIDIHNLIDTRFTCGISQTSSAGTNILCALPLFGGHVDVIEPIEKVLLTFATDAVNTGTVIYQSFAPALMVDMTGAPGNARSVKYNIDKNWVANTDPWATQYPASTDLAPLLINQNAQLVQAAQKGLKAIGMRSISAAQADGAARVDVNNVPEGHYTNVKVTPITGTSGYLTGGTGTMSSIGVFSCGDFASNDFPKIDDQSTIIATNSATGRLYQFGAKCTHAGKTSDYK